MRENHGYALGGTTVGDTDFKESPKEALGNEREKSRSGTDRPGEEDTHEDQGKISRRAKVGCGEARGDVKDGQGRHEKANETSRRERGEYEEALPPKLNTQ